MVRGMRWFALALSICLFVGCIVMTGCSKSPNEKQMAALEETQKAAVAAEDQMAKLEKENAELKAKLEAKKQELKDVQAEKAKVLTKAGQ